MVIVVASQEEEEEEKEGMNLPPSACCYGHRKSGIKNNNLKPWHAGTVMEYFDAGALVEGNL